VVELLPLAVGVTEYQMAVRRCPHCGKRTRADLPAGAARRPFGPRLTAVIALLSGAHWPLGAGGICWTFWWPRVRQRCGAAYRRLGSRPHARAEPIAPNSCERIVSARALIVSGLVSGPPYPNWDGGCGSEGRVGSDNAARSRVAERILTVVASCRQ
jgi:hypothetical protein